MFFVKEHFRKIADDNLATVIAQVANEILDQHGTVMFGNYFSNGAADRFSTDKVQGDSHTCLAIGMIEMGFLPHKGTVSVNRADSDELVDIAAQRIKALERDNKDLRTKK